MKHTMKRLTALLFVVILLGAMLPTALAADVLITKQPRNASAYAGERASTTVTATGDGLTYQWYIAAEGSSNFKKSSITKASYGVIMSESNDGRQAYCVVTDQNGNTAKTNTVTLSLRTALAVTTQPKSVTVKEGATAKVTIAATGDGLTYAWYYKNPGATKFSKTTAFTGKTYSVAMDASRDGRQVYCVITDKYGSTVQTNTATLSMQHPVKITAQPKTAYAYEGATAKTSVTATGDGLTYAWYIASATGTKFSKSSVTASSYGAKMSAASDGRRVYCVVKDKYGNTAQTNTVTLNVAAPFAITAQPKSVAVKDGEKAVVSFKAKGDGLTYTWYFKNAGASKFSKTTSFKSNSYSITMDSSRAGRQVYCVVKDITGKTLQTNTVTLDLFSPFKITQQPKDAWAYEGKTAKVTVGTDKEGLTYTWYIAAKGSSKFSKSSVTASSYGTKMSESSDGRQVYCVVSDAYGNTVQTETVTLNMAAPFEITQYPEDVCGVPDGETASVTVEATGTNLQYQWYWAKAGSTKFSKASTTKATYSMPMDESRNGRQLYCVVTDATGMRLTTDIVNIYMMPCIAYRYERNATYITQYCGSSAIVHIPPELDGYRVASIDYMAFYLCDSVKSIVLPDGLSSIGAHAFGKCSNLTSINIPDGVNVISDGAFLGCSSLTSISIPDGVWSIGTEAFCACSSLTSITIPDSMIYIDSYAFLSCSSLTSITLPDSVTSIGNNAFMGCDSLTVKCVENSYAHTYCVNNNIPFKLI